MVDVEGADLARPVSEGFPPATAEKVVRLLGLLREFQARSGTRDMFTLKGGTALNVFYWTPPPRLSVDLDLMSTGFPDASPRSSARREVLGIIAEVSAGLGYMVQEAPSDAVCNFTLSYRNHLGGPDRIRLDVDMLNRVTILPPDRRTGPALFGSEDLEFPVTSAPELFGQKLTAVAYRAAPRDLFDLFLLIREGWPRQYPASRAMYLAYSFLQDHEWARLDYPMRLEVPYDPARLSDVLRSGSEAPSLEQIRAEVRTHLHEIPRPFTRATPEEEELRRQLLAGDHEAFGAIAGVTDAASRRNLSNHPGLVWRLRQASRPPAMTKRTTGPPS